MRSLARSSIKVSRCIRSEKGDALGRVCADVSRGSFHRTSVGHPRNVISPPLKCRVKNANANLRRSSSGIRFSYQSPPPRISRPRTRARETYLRNVLIGALAFPTIPDFRAGNTDGFSDGRTRGGSCQNAISPLERTSELSALISEFRFDVRRCRLAIIKHSIKLVSHVRARARYTVSNFSDGEGHGVRR